MSRQESLRPRHVDTGRSVRATEGNPSRSNHSLLHPPCVPCSQVVLATNVAETSLTITGIRTIIDLGLVKEKRYDPSRGRRHAVAPPLELSRDQLHAPMCVVDRDGDAQRDTNLALRGSPARRPCGPYSAWRCVPTLLGASACANGGRAAARDPAHQPRQCRPAAQGDGSSRATCP